MKTWQIYKNKNGTEKLSQLVNLGRSFITAIVQQEQLEKCFDNNVKDKK
jgi:hypothetical protein